MQTENRHDEIQQLIESGDYEAAFSKFIAAQAGSALATVAEKLYARFTQNEREFSKAINPAGNLLDERAEISEAFAALVFKADAPPTVYLSFVKQPPLAAHLVLGRKSDLKAIADCFEKGDHLLLLNGMGGVGKSTLAGFYMERMAHQYRHIGWVRYSGNFAADCPRELTNYDGLRIPAAEREQYANLPPEAQFDRLVQYLERLPCPNLLIVDNLNTLADAEDAAARSAQLPHGWKLLITAREHNDGLPHHSVGVLPLEDARRLFLRHCPQPAPITNHESPVTNHLDTLLEQVGRHTLVIEFLAKTCAAQGWPPEKMLARLRERGLAHLDTSAQVPTAHNKNQRANMVEYISALFDINLATLTDHERWLLANLSMLPSFAHAYSVLEEMLFYPVPVEEIKTSFLTRIKRLFIPEKPVVEKRDKLDKDALAPLLHDLTAKGYLEKHPTRRPTHPNLEDPAPEEDGFYMHPVMAEVVREKEQPGMETCGELVGYFINKYYSGDDKENPALAFPWLPYGEALGDRLLEDIRKGILTNNLSQIYLAKGEFMSALKWQQMTIAIWENMLGKNDPTLPTFYNNLSEIYRTLGNLPLALTWQHKSIAMKEKIFGGNHFSLADSYNNLCLIYQAQGDLPPALEWQQKAIAIKAKVLKKDHPSLAASYNNLSLIHQDLGDLPSALELQQKAIAIIEKTLGNYHPHLAISLYNISTIYNAMNQPQTALPLIQRAVVILQQNFPQGHTDLDNALTWLERIQQRAAEAEGEGEGEA